MTSHPSCVLDIGKAPGRIRSAVPDRVFRRAISVIALLVLASSARQAATQQPSFGTVRPLELRFSFAFTKNQRGLALGDFDGDGRLDMALAADYPTQIAVFFAGTAPFTFPRILTVAYKEGCYSYNLAAGRFTNAPRDTLVASGFCGVYMIELDDRIPKIRGPFARGTYAGSVVVVDQNGDGNNDVIVADEGYLSDDGHAPWEFGLRGRNAGVLVMLGNGQGWFDVSQRLPLETGARGLEIGDFDGNGLPDLAVGHEYTERDLSGTDPPLDNRVPRPLGDGLTLLQTTADGYRMAGVMSTTRSVHSETAIHLDQDFGACLN